MISIRLWLAVGTLVATLCGHAAMGSAQSTYTITDLGSVTGALSCAASAINDYAEIVGSCSGSGTFNEVAFVWSNGVMTTLGKLPKTANYSEAHAINAKGVTVGEGDTGDYRPHPTLYRNGSVIDIDATGGNARAIYITDNGVIVGDYSKGFGNVSSWSAVIWTERPTQPGRFDRVSLQPYPGGDSKVRYGYATGANQSAQVVGWVQNSLFGQMGAFWDNDTNHSLALLPPLAGDWTSLAWGMNDLGQTVGESHPPAHTRAVMWNNDATHSTVALGTLPGHTDSAALAVNNLGQVIGYSYNSVTGETRPFLWQNGLMVDVNAFIHPASGWVIDQVTAINNVGQIVGLGRRNGRAATFVLTPPTP